MNLKSESEDKCSSTCHMTTRDRSNSPSRFQIHVQHKDIASWAVFGPSRPGQLSRNVQRPGACIDFHRLLDTSNMASSMPWNGLEQSIVFGDEQEISLVTDGSGWVAVQIHWTYSSVGV